MKRLLLISILALLFSGANYAVTLQISGTVTNITSGLPIANQTVYIMSDSSVPAFFFYNQAITNSSGQYLATATGVPTGNPITFYLYTIDCNGNASYQTSVFIGGTTMVVNFQICSGTPTTCQALFYSAPDSSNPTSGVISFFNASTGSPTTFAWTFGDGGTSASQYPVHTYTSPGSYNVCLTITSATCTDTYCDSIWVGALPCSNYFIQNSTGLTATFAGFSLNGVAPITYTWNFGDGNTGTGMNATHTYASSGYYTVTLTVVDGNGCSSTSSQYSYVGNSVPYLFGQVTAGSNYLDYGQVYLYIQNPATSNLYLMDTTIIDSSGMYWFSNVAAGTYYILAAPAANSAYYTTYSPAYYQSSVFWAGATAITLGTAANPYDIALVQLLTPNAGNGSISGILTQGAKFNVQGPPVPHVEILLLNTSNQALSIKYTDAAGLFNFSNLAMGTYKVYAEVTGLPTTPYVTTLTANNPVNSNVGLVMTPNGIALGINDKPVLAGLSETMIYPNPARDVLNVSIETLAPEKLTAMVFDLTGKVVLNQQMNIGQGNTTSQIDISQLQPGFYTLTLTHENGKKTTVKLSKMQ